MIAEESDWKNCVQGSTAVVNLAGLPISTRWSPEVSFFLHLSLKFDAFFFSVSLSLFALQIKKEIKDSRIRVTSKVSDYCLLSLDCDSKLLLLRRFPD